MLQRSPLAADGVRLAVQKMLENATGRAAICSSMRLASSIDAALRASLVA